MPYFGPQFVCNQHYQDQKYIPYGEVYFTTLKACQDNDATKSVIGTYDPNNQHQEAGGGAASGAAELVLTLINDLIGLIAGTKASILTRTLDEVQHTQRLITNVNDSLSVSTRLLSDQIESSRSNIVRNITTAVSAVNEHADENTSKIIRTLNANQKEVIDGITTINAKLDNIGDALGKAVADALEPLTRQIRESSREINDTIENGLTNLGRTVTQAIALQDAHYVAAIDRASQSIDKLNESTKELTRILHEDLTNLTFTLKTSLDRNTDVINKAIRESAFGLTLAINADTAADTAGSAAIAAAVLAGCTEIATAITASRTAALAANAGKLAQELLIGEKILAILAGLGLLEGTNPSDLFAEISKTIVEMYYNTGKEIYDKLGLNTEGN